MATASGYLEVRAFSEQPKAVRVYPEPRIIEHGLSFKERFQAWVDNTAVRLGGLQSSSLPFEGGYSVRIFELPGYPKFKQPVRIGDKSADVTKDAVIHVLNTADEVVARFPVRALDKAPHILDTMLLQRRRLR